jgi:uncharacterized RDD family membrane protein YckC
MEVKSLYEYDNTPARSYDYGGFWIRFVALLIDSLILMVVSGILLLVLKNSDGLRNILSILINAVYFVYMESSLQQATIGKQLMNLKVTDENYERITIDRAIIRYVCKIPSGLILMIGFIMAAFDHKKQALHDKLAKTYVINSTAS